MGGESGPPSACVYITLKSVVVVCRECWMIDKSQGLFKFDVNTKHLSRKHTTRLPHSEGRVTWSLRQAAMFVKQMEHVSHFDLHLTFSYPHGVGGRHFSSFNMLSSTIVCPPARQLEPMSEGALL